MNNKNNNEIEEIQLNFYNEISVKDLIFAIDNAKEFSLYEINEEESFETGEKNILIKINKNNRK